MIYYLHGDARLPQGTGNKIIAHVCNDLGFWGSGFVMALSEFWHLPENEYRLWSRGESYVTDEVFGLGNVQFVPTEHKLWIANMVAQHGVRGADNPKPIRYDALQSCLTKVAAKARELQATIHGPKFGADRAGGDWQKIEQLINETCSDIEVTIYLWK
jgi:O-acetyl-ADP-ribose deacetylase (regulator of RNase III)